MFDETFVDRCKSIAERVHINKKRMDNSPYMDHINGVVRFAMLILSDYSVTREDIQYIIGLSYVHDCLEDSEEFLQNKELFFGQFSDILTKDELETFKLDLDLLTHKKTEKYLTYILKIKRIPRNPPKIVKHADMLYNYRDCENTSDRVKKYLKTKYELSANILFGFDDIDTQNKRFYDEYELETNQ